MLTFRSSLPIASIVLSWSGHAPTGLPPTLTSARTRPSPGSMISSLRAAVGISPNTSPRPRTRLGSPLPQAGLGGFACASHGRSGPITPGFGTTSPSRR